MGWQSCGVRGTSRGTGGEQVESQSTLVEIAGGPRVKTFSGARSTSTSNVERTRLESLFVSFLPLAPNHKMQSEASYQPATTLSPFSYVVCSRCRRGYKDFLDPADSFYLTDCSHTLCQTCTSEAQPGPVEGIIQCPIPECRHEGQFMRLDPEGEMDGVGPRVFGRNDRC